MVISRKAQSIEPSVTLSISAKAKQMKSEGIDVVSFGAGEPDFDTPDNIKEAGIAAIRKGETKYTPASGTLELKKAVAEMLKSGYGLDYEPAQISINCGAKHSIFNALFVLCDPGDEVILPTPYWVSYPEQIKLSDGVPVYIETSDKTSFKITAKQLEEAITPRTRVLILNSPSNPTGMMYSQAELKAIAEVVKKHSIVVISDEIYDRLTYDGNEHVSIASIDGMKDLTVLINGVSKTYSMTGWRIGYMAGPKEIISAVNAFQSHSTSNPASMSQKASVEAIAGSQAAVGEMVKAFDERRRYMVGTLNGIEGITCIMPQGAFYAFPNISALFGKSYKGKKINGSLDFSNILLDEAKVAVIPGVGFGADCCIRLSYATSMANIEKGLGRIKEFVSQLS